MRIVVLLCTLIIISCKNQEEPVISDKSDSHSKMISILEKIKQESEATPHYFYHLNDLRANKIKRIILQSQTKNEFLQNSFRYLEELLNSGDTESMINEIESFAQAQNISFDNIDTSLKPFYDIWALAYLRLGEQKNCLENHSNESCIIPINGSGIHSNVHASSKAIELYEKLVLSFPEDLQSKWLLNLAYMTLGKYPQDVPNVNLITLSPSVKNQFKRFKEIGSTSVIGQNGLSGGVCIEDFNGDGYKDIICSAYGFDENIMLFLNNAKSGFLNATEKSNLNGITGGLNINHADYDNDGDIDVYVMRGGWFPDAGRHPNSLLQNQGDATFKDVTFDVGLYSESPGQSSAWGDFDLDGDLDLFVVVENSNKTSNKCQLYQNNGNGHFINVAETYNLDFKINAKACSWGDINNDLYPDLFISNLTGPNLLLKNLGVQEGIFKGFENISKYSGIEEPMNSFPSWFWDVNQDGYDDLIVFSYDLGLLKNVGGIEANALLDPNYRVNTPFLYINEGNDHFINAAEAYQLNKPLFAMGCNFGDLNNDGFLDFYVGTGAPDFRSIVPNRMYINQAGKAFLDVSYASGFAHIQKGHGISFCDLNEDGFQDVYAVMGGAVKGDPFHNILFENPGFENNYIKIRLKGTESNYNAIGAKVELTYKNASNETQRRYYTVSSGSSFGTNPLELHIGVGNSIQIDTLTIHWPNKNKSKQQFNNVGINQYILITENKGITEVLSLNQFDFNLGHSEHHHNLH